MMATGLSLRSLSAMAFAVLIASGCSGLSHMAPFSNMPGGGDSTFGVQTLSLLSQTGGPNLLYVSNTCGNNAIETFPMTATGNVAPMTTIAGANTLLNQPFMLYAFGTTSIWAGDFSANAMVAFGAMASGNIAPAIDIAGSNLGAWHPAGVVRDSSGTTYVADYYGNRLVALAASANGNAAPLRTISGSVTGLDAPFGLTLDPSANLVVAVYGSSKIETFSRTGSGNVSPLHTLAGAATLLSHPRSVAFDASGNLYVSNPSANSILVFAPGAAGNTAPIRVISGGSTELSFPSQIALDPRGDLFVANRSSNTVTVYAPGASGNAAPARKLGGLACPSGIALGNLPVSYYTSRITANAAIFQMVDGIDGRIWFSEFNGNNVGAITTSGTVSEYATGGQPNGITVGADNNYWSGGYGGTIFKMNGIGSLLASYPVSGAHFGCMIRNPDGNVWFTDYGNNKVGKVTTAGVVSEFALPLGASPNCLASDTEGNLWVTDGGKNAIDKVNISGTVLAAFSSGLTAGDVVNGIVSAPDANLYFTEDAFNSSKSDKIGRITMGGTITEIRALAPNTYPDLLTVGKDGNIYFSEYDRTNLGRIDLATGTVTEFPLTLNGDSGTSAIINGPDNRLWLGGYQTIYALNY